MTTRLKDNFDDDTEGNVYLCSWSKKEKYYRIVLKQDHDIEARGESFEEAQENMWEVLCERFGDKEAVVEYDKPLPESEFKKQFGRPEILVVSGNGSLGSCIGDATLFSESRCTKCTRPLGRRTKQSASFDYLPNSDGATSFNDIGPIFSDRFLALLSEHEKQGMRFLPVLGATKGQTRLFELIGDPIANFVGVPRFPGLLSKRCMECGSFGFTYLYQNELFQFIALCDLPKPMPPVFVIGDANDPKLCMTRARYQSIIGKKGTKNICTRQIWVVPDEKFVRNPEDENYPEELYWKSPRIHVRYAPGEVRLETSSD